MPMMVFWSRFARHAALAFAAWVGFAFGVERLIPGFISPFVDLPQALLVLIVIVAVVCAFAPKGTAWGRWAGIVIVAFSLIAAGAFLWTRLSGGGASATIFMVAAVVFAGLSTVALFTSGES